MNFDLTNLTINSYEDIKPYFDNLVEREISTKEETEQWIKDYDALQSFLSEDFARRYIHQSCHTKNEEYKKAYETFIKEVSPKIQEVEDLLNKKIIALPGLEELQQENSGYKIRLRGIQKSLEMYREENIPLFVELADKQKQYDEIAGDMSIEHDGKELTMQQAKKYLELSDRVIRKEVYDKMRTRREQDKETLDNLLSELIQLRTQIAKNAGYESFIEYQWDAFRRFDYTQQDVFDFHKGVKEHIVPLLQKIYEERSKKLGIDGIKPYDEDATEQGLEPLNPFETGDELLEKGTQAVGAVSSEFADNLRTMKEHGHFDLSSRPGKAPGGYNYPLAVSHYPFIFMNAAGVQQDVVTFVHEAGHAMHSFCIEEKGIPLNIFKDFPIEMAEVASMSMELMSMYEWDSFYSDPADKKRAQEQEIERVLEILPWVAIVDSFQYWLYKNPSHTVEERHAKFKELLDEYKPFIDRNEYEHVQHIRWQAQMHIYDFPLYYIEYGIAQLGAIGVWKNYIEDRQKALELYKTGLSLGSTKKLPELYEAAGVPFDFSPARIKELANFVWSEREKLLTQ